MLCDMGKGEVYSLPSKNSCPHRCCVFHEKEVCFYKYSWPLNKWPLRCFPASRVLRFCFYYTLMLGICHIVWTKHWEWTGSQSGMLMALISILFEFLEAVFVFMVVWFLTFCNIWSPATLSLFTVKSMEKLTSWQCSAKSKVKPLTGEQTQSFHLRIVIWPL